MDRIKMRIDQLIWLIIIKNQKCRGGILSFKDKEVIIK